MSMSNSSPKLLNVSGMSQSCLIFFGGFIVYADELTN